MKQINKEMNAYRECIRNLWNIHFLQLVSLHKNWDDSDNFDQICTMLFSALVLHPLCLSTYRKSFSYEQYPKPIDPLHVKSVTASVPIMINREIKSVGYWDYPIKSIDSEQVDMRFIDLFDFEQMGFRDFEYYRVRIVDAPTSKDLIGRDAIIKCSSVEVCFSPEAR